MRGTVEEKGKRRLRFSKGRERRGERGKKRAPVLLLLGFLINEHTRRMHGRARAREGGMRWIMRVPRSCSVSTLLYDYNRDYAVAFCYCLLLLVLVCGRAPPIRRRNFQPRRGN